MDPIANDPSTSAPRCITCPAWSRPLFDQALGIPEPPHPELDVVRRCRGAGDRRGWLVSFAYGCPPIRSVADDRVPRAPDRPAAGAVDHRLVARRRPGRRAFSEEPPMTWYLLTPRAARVRLVLAWLVLLVIGAGLGLAWAAGLL